jgi:hypothetical protein
MASATSTSSAPSSRRRFLQGAAAVGVAGAATAAGQLASVQTAGATVVAGTELGYAESVVHASTTTSLAVPNLVLSVVVADAPIAIEYGAYIASSAASGFVKLHLMRDGVPVHEIGASVAGARGFAHVQGRCRIAPTKVGTTVFTVLVANWTANATAHVVAMPLSPAFISARGL